MIKCVLFDMDGVLIDAREWHYDALNRALELFGHRINRVEHLESYDGLPTRRKLEMLTKERQLPRGLHEFINQLKQKYTLELVYRDCRPVFQHLYALSRLKAEGRRLVVCSNSIRQTMDVMLNQADLVQFLDFYVSAEEVEMPKPDPEIYLKAIARLGVAPTECLVVEDNVNGIKAARASGAHVMRVSGVEEVNYKNIASHLAEHDAVEYA